MHSFLETERLILRLPTSADFEELLALRSDPEAMKYIGDGLIQSKEGVERFLSIEVPYHEKHGHGFCCVFEKDGGALVGQAGVFHIGLDDQQPEIEVAYRLHKNAWGKGYATELAKALIKWGFENLPVQKLVAVINPNNNRSRCVLEKVGMKYVGKENYYNNEVDKYEIYKI